jgi:hypothetical protein
LLGIQATSLVDYIDLIRTIGQKPINVFEELEEFERISVTILEIPFYKRPLK